MVLNIFKFRLKLLNFIECYKAKRRLRKLGYCGKNVKFGEPALLSDYSKVYLYDGAELDPNFVLLSWGGRFIFGKNSSAAIGLTVITGNHGRRLENGIMNLCQVILKT